LSPRRRFVALVLLGALLAGSVGAVASVLLYRTALAREAAALNAVVLSHAAVAEAVFHDEIDEHVGDTAAAVSGMLEQLRSSYRRFEGFGATGEFVVARLRGDTIVFDIGLRGDTARLPDPILLPAPRATSMQRALAGGSGVGRDVDYAGRRVMAAYTPISGTGAGMVAKMDLAEVRAPFVRTAVTSGAVGLLLLLLAVGVGSVVGSPLVAEVEEREEELGASRERLRLAILAGGHGLYDLDLRTGEAVVNDEYARMLGYDPATFVETNAAWRDRLHPDDRRAAYAEYEAYVGGRRDTYRVEFRQRTAQGGWHWILSLGAIVEWDAEGRPVRMVGTHTDIQARKDAEAALSESEERFRRAVEASPEAVFIQTKGQFAYVNPSAVQLFGARSDGELLGTSILDRFPPGMRETIQARMQATNVERRAAPTLLESVLRSDGTEVKAEVSAVPFRYQGEDGALVFARDVTERVEAEETLRAHVEELRRWQAVMLDREDRVQELKREINELCRRAGEEPHYPSQLPAAGAEAAMP